MIRPSDRRADHAWRDGRPRANSKIEEENAGVAENDKVLTIESERAGRNGIVVVTVKLGDEVVGMDKLDLTRRAARDKFAGKVCIDHEEVSQENLSKRLLDLASTKGTNDTAPTSPEVGREIDTSRLVRPERAITPEVSTVAIPSMTTLGEKVAGRWQLYLRWADGRREQRALGPTIELADGSRLWVYPNVSEPTPNTNPGWSTDARRRWLDGEPAPDPAEVFKRVCERIDYFLDLPLHHVPGVTATLACWVILSYSYSAWSAVPYLYLGGPLGSGKSRVFEILARLVFRPLASSNMTAASLFRTLHSNGGTLLLDEAERLRNTRDPDVGEIRSLLLAGYKWGGAAIRLEPVGDNGFKTVSFDVYGPKALACISGLPAALASRAITITMFRAAPGSTKPRRRIDADPSGWQRLRDDLHALALEHGSVFLGLADRTDVCPEMSGRDFELWQPILALASWIESHGADGLLDLLKEHALKTIDVYADDQVADVDEVLLRLLADAVREGEAPQPKELLERARDQEPDSFKTWSPKGVAAALSRYSLRTNKTGGCKLYGRVTLHELRKIQATYALDLGFEQAEEFLETPSGPPVPDGG